MRKIVSHCYVRVRLSYLLLIFTFVTVLGESNDSAFTEFEYPPTCPYSKAAGEFTQNVHEPCLNSTRKCIERQITQFNATDRNAKDYCWHRPLRVDPRYLGACPEYMEKLESEVHISDENALPRLFMRTFFEKSEVEGKTNASEHVVTFKEDESREIINSMYANDPTNLYIISLHDLYAWPVSSEVEKFNLILRQFEREPDCPQTLWRLPDTSYKFMYDFTHNWLVGSGNGSELNDEEMLDLIKKVRYLVKQSYDKNMKQGNNAEEYLYWAAASLEDSVLSADSHEGFRQAYDKLGIDYKNYIADRKKCSLII